MKSTVISETGNTSLHGAHDIFDKGLTALAEWDITDKVGYNGSCVSGYIMQNLSCCWKVCNKWILYHREQ